MQVLFIHLFIHSFIYLLILNPFLHSSIFSFIRAFVNLYIHSLEHSSIHIFIHLVIYYLIIHSFIHSLLLYLCMLWEWQRVGCVLPLSWYGPGELPGYCSHPWRQWKSWVPCRKGSGSGTAGQGVFVLVIYRTEMGKTNDGVMWIILKWENKKGFWQVKCFGISV